MPAIALALALLVQPVTAAPPAAPTTRAPAAVDITGIAAATGLPPLAGDALRFTDISPGGTTATVFDARRTATGSERTILTLSASAGGWSVDTRETRRLAAETFDYLRGRITAAIATGGPQAPCPDGSDYLAELAGGAGGGAQMLRGCGANHPNVALARLLGARDTP